MSAEPAFLPPNAETYAELPKSIRMAAMPKSFGGPREIRKPAWMAFAQDLTNAERWMLDIIGYRAQNLRCRFSVRKLSEQIHRHHSVISKHLANLEAKGYIYSEDGTTTRGGNAEKTYWLLPYPPAGWEAPYLDDDEDDELPVEPIDDEGQERDEESADPTVTAIRAFLRQGQKCDGASPSGMRQQKNGPSSERKEQGRAESTIERLSPGENADALQRASTAPCRGGAPSPAPADDPFQDSEAPTEPGQAVRVTAALRAWCSAECPSVDPDEALRAWERFHRGKGQEPPSGRYGDRQFRGWCVRRQKLADRSSGDGRGRSKPLNFAFARPNDLSRTIEELRGQIGAGTPRQKNLHAAMIQVFRQLGPDGWKSYLTGSVWTLEQPSNGRSNHAVEVVIETSSKTAARLLEERYGDTLTAAVKTAFGRGRTWRIDVTERRENPASQSVRRSDNAERNDP
jgi:hypothetical protein